MHTIKSSRQNILLSDKKRCTTLLKKFRHAPDLYPYPKPTLLKNKIYTLSITYFTKKLKKQDKVINLLYTEVLKILTTQKHLKFAAAHF